VASQKTKSEKYLIAVSIFFQAENDYSEKKNFNFKSLINKKGLYFLYRNCFICIIAFTKANSD